MPYMEIAIIVAFGLLNALLTVLMARWMVRSMMEGFQVLDGRVGEAITTLVNDAMEVLPMNADPPNPFVQLFADYMKNQLNPSIVAKDITRDDSGKFQSDNI